MKKATCVYNNRGIIHIRSHKSLILFVLDEANLGSINIDLLYCSYIKKVNTLSATKPSKYNFLTSSDKIQVSAIKASNFASGSIV